MFPWWLKIFSSTGMDMSCGRLSMKQDFDDGGCVLVVFLEVTVVHWKGFLSLSFSLSLSRHVTYT